MIRKARVSNVKDRTSIPERVFGEGAGLTRNASDRLYTKDSRLLPDAESAENLMKYIFGGGVAGNFTQAVQGGLKI